MEIIMNEDTELELGVIPAGTRVRLFEGRVTLLEDVEVDVSQKWIDKAIRDQDEYYKGVNCCSQLPKDEL